MKLKQITIHFLLTIGLTAGASDVVWFDGQHPVSYQVVGKTDPVVKIALQMFESDMLQVTGMKPVEGGKRIAATIRIVQGKGSDDGFRLSVKNGQILNGRGTPLSTPASLRQCDRGRSRRCYSFRPSPSGGTHSRNCGIS